MPTPTYVDPAADRAAAIARLITSAFESGLGLESEVSFGTRHTGKRYGILAIATNSSETGGREGVPRGLQRYKLRFNYQYVAVVANDGTSPSVSYINGETAYHIQQFQGFVDSLNGTLPAGNMIAEVRVESMDALLSQQTKPPHVYEISLLGSIGVQYYVSKDMFAAPRTALYPTIDSSIDY